MKPFGRNGGLLSFRAVVAVGIVLGVLAALP